MAYTELIKNFNKIRDYMREFYIYGFKSREDFSKKSPRSYDDERRRIESWLGDYMSFKRREGGKNVFISIDTKDIYENPLYRGYKAKSFTDGDITLHFILMDIFSQGKEYSLNEIIEKIDCEYLSCFREPMVFDDSGIRKKLKEYVSLGIVKRRKEGRGFLYSRPDEVDISEYKEAVSFFSEVSELGVIGSFINDRYGEKNKFFTFKHHYIMSALDSDVLFKLYEGMGNKCAVYIKKTDKYGRKEKNLRVIPLKIFISARSGRQHLMAYNSSVQKIQSYRVDYITEVKTGEICEDFDYWREKLEGCRHYIWGVSCMEMKKSERVEFTLHIEDNEEHIVRRLEREKRWGKVERIDKNTCKFVADVYDTYELKPWIRTFICRIKEMNFSNRTVENELKEELKQMYKMYGVESDAV